jgi:DNA-binding transcriptional MerR regulator
MSSQLKQPDAGDAHADAKGPSLTRGARKAPSAFRTISEVADELAVQQHVLRFWETKFTQVKPLKRGGGRRYYRPEDVALLRRIHHLLYTEGYTIKGVQKLMKGQGRQQAAADAPTPVGAEAPAPAVTARDIEAVSPARSVQTNSVQGKAVLSDKQRGILETMLGELKDLREMVGN